MKKLLVILAIMLMAVGCSSNTSTVEDDTFVGELLVSDKIIIGTSPDYAPYEFIGETGEIEGFDVDMVEAVVNEINKQNQTELTYEFKSMDFGIIVGSLEAKQIDLGVSGFTYDPERNVTFSTPYIISGQVVVVAEGSDIMTIADLEGKNIGVQTGTTGETAAQALENVELTSISDSTMLFQMLNAGNVDAVVCDVAVGDNYVANMDVVKLDEVLIDENMSIISHNDNTKLAEVIDNAIKALQENGELDQIKAKWGL